MIRLYGLLALILISLTPEYAQSTQPVASSAETITLTRLIGSWTLVKHGHFNRSGQYHSTGDQMSGQLIYAPDGSMSVLITKIPKPAQLSDIIAYSGTFSIAGNKVLHHIRVSPDPRLVGTTAIRLISFQGADLVLKTEPNADGYWEIVWRK